jgi:hypothetical protein
MSWLGFLGTSAVADELPDIYPIPIASAVFVDVDVQNIYTRILTDTLERTQGIPEEKKTLLWDNCLASESQDGLVTLVAKAMVAQKDLFLVWVASTKVIRKATSLEETRIRDGYKEKAEAVNLDKGAIGIFVTFKNYDKSKLVRFYSMLEYCAVGGLWKQSNLSKAIQIKINDLRGSVSMSDSAVAKAQAKKMAEGLGAGKDVLMDAKDIIESLTPDMTATNSALELIGKKQSFYLGMPSSYFNGEQSTGLGDSGKKDSKAVDRGLKGYYFSVIKPIIDSLFAIKTTFKSEDTEGLDTALKVLETFDRTSDEHLGAENKTLIVNKAFGLDLDEVGDGPEPEPVIDPNAPPAIDPKTGKPIEKPPVPGQKPPNAFPPKA